MFDNPPRTLDFDRDEQPDYDFVIVTGDVDETMLYVHRVVLRTASGFFKDMLSLPQPVEKAPSDESNRVKIHETASIMRILLNLIYPTAYDPIIFESYCKRLADLETLHDLLRTSIKYSLDRATHRISSQLVTRAESNPSEAMRIFASASALGMEDLTSKVSQYCLRRGLKNLIQSDATYYEPPPPPPPPASATSSPQLRPASVASFAGSFADRMYTDEYPRPNRRLHQEMKLALTGDVFRLMDLYIWRMERIKNILDSSSLMDRNTCNGYTNGHEFGRRFVDAAKGELERSGPFSGRIFANDFLVGTIEVGCSNCAQRLLVDSRETLQTLKTRIDSLPDSI